MQYDKHNADSHMHLRDLKNNHEQKNRFRSPTRIPEPNLMFFRRFRSGTRDLERNLIAQILKYLIT